MSKIELQQSCTLASEHVEVRGAAQNGGAVSSAPLFLRDFYAVNCY